MGFGFLLFASVICPKYLILDFKESHLSKQTLKPYCFIFFKNSYDVCPTCRSRLSLNVDVVEVGFCEINIIQQCRNFGLVISLILFFKE